ncbi:MAG: AAA family ATPase [Terrimicrobiaceae bacterium]
MAAPGSPALKTVRIFVSSPGDVQSERDISERVIHSLSGEFAGRLRVEGFFWEYEPMVVTKDFQDQIPRPSSFDIVVCILWSRLGSRLHTKHHRPDGTLYSSGTEYEFEDAAAANLERGEPEILLYVNRTPPSLQARTRPEREEALRQIDALEDFLEHWTHDAGEDTWKGAFTGYTDLARFEKFLEEHLRRLLLKRAPQAAVSDAPPQTPWKGGSPFRGLQSFDLEHAEIFFGRTRAIEDVLKVLKRRQSSGAPAFVLISGMSGSGKSSLARAGVLPLLTRPGVIEGTGVWKWAIMRPGAKGAGEALLRALREAGLDLPAEIAGPDALVEAVERWLAQESAGRHAEDRRSLEDRIGEYERAGRKEDAERCRALLKDLAPPRAALALVIDQLEELVGQESAEREEFAARVAALATCGRVSVLATMRADRFPALRDAPALAALCEGDGVYTLLPPDRSSIGQMIRRPALAAGLMFEVDPRTGEHLDELLRDGALNDPSCLPSLQFTLEELYRRRDPGNLLTLASYRELGGIEGAVGRRAEEVFLALDSSVREALPLLLRAVADPGEKGAVRRWASCDSINENPSVAALAEALVEARLMVRDRAPDGSSVISVAHEALLSAWPRAAEWCVRDAEFLRLRAHLRDAAALWREERNSADFLLAEGKPLADAEALLSDGSANLDAGTKGFIEESSRYRRRERTKSLRRVRAVALVMAVLAICAGAAAVFGFVQKRAAENRAAELREALAEADMQLASRMVEAGTPDRALAPLARAIGEKEAAAWRVAFLLRQRGWFLPDGPALKLDGAVRSVAFSPDGRLFAVAGDFGFARIYESGTGAPAGPEFRQAGTVWKAVFSPDGKLLATGAADGSACLWNVADGTQAGTPLALGADVTNLKFSPDGKYLLAALGTESTGTESGAIQLCDVGTGKPKGERISIGTAVLDIGFSPDGASFAAGLLDGTVKVWETKSGRLLLAAEPCGEAAESVTFNPAGNLLLVAYADGIARIFDPAQGTQPVVVFEGHTGPLTQAAFSPDGKRVVTSSSDGTSRIWPVGGGEPLLTIPAGGFVQSAAFTPDGTGLLTLSQFPSQESSIITGTLRLWDVSTGKELLTPLTSTSPACDFAFDAQGRWLLAGSADGVAAITGLKVGESPALWAELPVAVRTIANAGPDRVAFLVVEKDSSTFGLVARDGQLIWKEAIEGQSSVLTSFLLHDQLAIGFDDGRVLLRRLSDGKVSFPESRLSTGVEQIVFSPDGNRWAAVPATNESEPAGVLVRDLWNPDSEPLRLVHPDRVRDAQFSPDGREMITACNDHLARIWDLAAGKVRLEIPHDGMVVSGNWSPDGRLVVTASDGFEQSYAQVWSAPDGRPKGARMEGAANGGAEFSPSAEFVITWNPSARPRLWETSTGKAHGLPLAHDGTERPVFVAEGRFLVTASSPSSGTFIESGPRGIRIWDVSSGLPVSDLIPTGDNEVRMAFPGDAILFTDGHATISRFPLPPSAAAPAWLARRAMATGRWKMQAGGSLERVSDPAKLWREAAGEAAAKSGPWDFSD